MRSLKVVGVVLLAYAAWGASAYAQDAAKVAPQNYTVVMENDLVRVLKMTLKPGEQDKQHSHPNEVVYFVNAAKAKIMLPGGEAVDADIPKGHVMFHEPWTHTVKNTGTQDLVAIVVELKEAGKQVEEKGEE